MLASRLAGTIALLGGRDKVVDDYARNARARRRKLKQDFAELDRLAEEEQRRKDQVWAEHQAILDRIELERLLKPRPVPRIARL